MATLKKLAALAAAAEAARRYARKNPDKAGKLVDQAAGFVDKQTKGKYKRHIDGGRPYGQERRGHPGDGYRTTQGVEKNVGYGAHPGYGPSSPAQPTTPQPPTPPAPPAKRLDNRTNGTYGRSVRAVRVCVGAARSCRALRAGDPRRRARLA